MDLSCFSQDSFDVVQWTNDYFKSNGSAEHKEVMVSSLVSRLQLYVEQMNCSLEKSSHQIMITMPHVIKDVKIIQAEVVTLTDKMRQLQNDISHVNRDTGVYMNKLERLESTFQKIRAAKHGMKESDGWGKLTAELDDLLERNDIFESKNKFIDLKKSISAQAGLPGQADRVLQFEYFTNRLEALASPVVIKHIQQGDITKCVKYVEIFEIIDRLPQLKQCYRTVHKNTLTEKWSKISEAEDSYDTNVLMEFNNVLLEFVQNQQKWCKQVFHSHLEPLDAVIDTLKNLKTAKQSYVMNQLKKTPNKFEYLASVATVDCQFTHALEKLLIEIPKDKLDDLSEAIFMYFDIFIEQYPNLERSFSNKMLDEMKLNNTTSVTENVGTLDNFNSKILKWFSDAIVRCTSITQNKSLVQLINIFRNYVTTYIGKYTTVQKQLVLNQAEEVNWSLLQLNINLLQYLGDFRQVIEQCEKKLYVSMNATELDSTNSIVCRMRYLYNNEKVREAVMTHSTNDANGLFLKELNALQKVAVEIHDSVLKHIFIYIETQFKEVEFTMKQHSEEYNLPDYSYAPQEYITQIGQYLLTLPQHLEPLLLSPSPALKDIMQFCEEKYKGEKPCADVMLFLIVEETTAMYQEKIDEILCLSASGAKQLATDIEYFGNVLEEMSLALSSNLQQIITLLRAPLDQYNAVSAGCNPRVVTSIRQKRNIISC